MSSKLHMPDFVASLKGDLAVALRSEVVLCHGHEVLAGASHPAVVPLKLQNQSTVDSLCLKPRKRLRVYGLPPDRYIGKSSRNLLLTILQIRFRDIVQ